MIVAGAIFEQTDIPFTVECHYEWVGEGFGARQEPMHEYWRIGERETQYGTTNDGLGRFELHVLEVVETQTCGTVAIYERRWFDPEGELLSKPRKKFSKVGNLKGFIRRRKMVAQAIEARRAETGTGSVHESAAPTGETPK